MSAPATNDFSPRAGKNHDAHGGILARIQQRVAQFVDSFTIQRVQHLRAIEGDVSDGIFFLEQDIFVGHCSGGQS